MHAKRNGIFGTDSNHAAMVEIALCLVKEQDKTNIFSGKQRDIILYPKYVVVVYE